MCLILQTYLLICLFHERGAPEREGKQQQLGQVRGAQRRDGMTPDSENCCFFFFLENFVNKISILFFLTTAILIDLVTHHFFLSSYQSNN